MDFNKFQQWCQDKGFVFKLPSGYTQLMGLEEKSFESFKGLFNLCLMFFYENILTNVNEETLTEANKVNKNDNFFVANPNTAIKYNNGSKITLLGKPNDTVKSSKRNWCDIGKEQRNKEYENSELKHLVDRVADKYDSED